MDNEKLNEKLAQWAGFKFVDKPRYFMGVPGAAVANYWITPDGVETPYSPNFTSDPTACFKWLLPKLYGIRIWFPSILFDKPTYAVAIWATSQTHAPIEAYDKSLALALCKAIEKLIEAENEA